MIRLDGLGKAYPRHATLPYRTLRDAIMGWLPGRRSTGPVGGPLWALRGVSTVVEPGEAVGIIGRNGAGKTTLLKLLAGVSAPTEGRIEIHGRTGNLLSVGSGFHSELTGRENIWLAGALLGMSQREIRRAFDEIVEYAGVSGVIDEPVKVYSTGMYQRLAFSLALAVEADILLVDEVLSVGDAAFTWRCLRRLDERVRAGCTLLLISHDLGLIGRLCQRVLVLEGGQLVSDGTMEAALSRYATITREAAGMVGGDGPIEAVHVHESGESGPILAGRPFAIDIQRQPGAGRLLIRLATLDGHPIAEWVQPHDAPTGAPTGLLRQRVSVATGLCPGAYQLELQLIDGEGRELAAGAPLVVDVHRAAGEDERPPGGMVELPAEWTVVPE